MAHGTIIVLGNRPTQRLKPFVIDYNKDESTHINCVCDGAGLTKGLPKLTGALVYSLELQHLDIDKLIATLSVEPTSSQVEAVLTSRDEWVYLGIECYQSKSALSWHEMPIELGKLLKRISRAEPFTKCTLYECHF